MSVRSCSLLILVLSVVSAAQSPQTKPDEAVILEQKNNFNGIDPWQWRYNTSDGQSREESGTLTANGKTVNLQGSYSWTSPEGITFTVTYKADEHGFVPTVTQKEAGDPVKVMKPSLNGVTHQGAGDPVRVLKPSLDRVINQGTGDLDKVIKPPLNGVTQQAAGDPVTVRNPTLDGVTEQGAGDPDKVMNPSLGGVSTLGAGDPENVMKPPFDGVTQQGQGGPVSVMKLSLNGSQAKPDTDLTTEQPPRQSSGLGLILGGLLLGTILG